jgi:hypothetical protein
MEEELEPRKVGDGASRRELIRLLSARRIPLSVLTSRGFPLARRRASGIPATTSDGSSLPLLHPQLLRSQCTAAQRSRRGLAADRPQERSRLAGRSLR